LIQVLRPGISIRSEVHPRADRANCAGSGVSTCNGRQWDNCLCRALNKAKEAVAQSKAKAAEAFPGETIRVGGGGVDVDMQVKENYGIQR